MGEWEMESKAFSQSRDDLYNLSVRKKVLQLCRRLFDNLHRAQACYGQIEEEDGRITGFMRENIQITGIIASLARAINAREKPEAPEFSPPPRSRIRYHLCALLVEIASDLVSLTSIISVPRYERELIFASDLLLKQLIYILPYKMHQ